MISYIIHYENNACSVRNVIIFSLASVFVWTGENDSIALRVDTYFSENGGEKISVFKTILDHRKMSLCSI